VALTGMADQIGRVVGGRYRILAPIGAGASAQVFLAEDANLRRRVALKVLHDSLAGDAAFLKRLQAEARAVAALRSEHVLSVYEWSADDPPYIVSEYLEGGSLRGMLDAGHLLSVSQAVLIGHQAAQGLQHAHSRSIVHRDIKPANLLFDDEGRLRIADFGVARAVAEAAVTEPDGATVGTARYASPELARGEPVSGASDLFSLALVLVEAVTGSVPGSLDTSLATLMARRDQPLVVPDETGVLKPVLEQLGTLDPAARIDAGRLATELVALTGDLDPPDPLPLVGAIAVPRAQVEAERDPTLHAATDDSETAGDGSPTGAAVGGAAAEADLAPAPVDPSTGRRWPFAAVAVVVALLVGGFTLFQITRPLHDVPSLEGMTIGDIDPLVEGNDWDIVEVGVRRDGTEVGDILAQDPAAGESLRAGDALTLTVSRGAELVPVPEGLTGLSEQEAATRLGDLGLEVGRITQKYNELAPEGTVLSPATLFAEVPAGSALDLVVSRGPLPRTIPDGLAGGTFEGAEAALAEVQLVAVVDEESSDDVAEGVVIRTEPGPGEEVPRDSEVVVVVSTGPPLVTVPDIFGDFPDSVADLLEGLGLEIAGTFGPPNRPVIDSDPSPGEEVEPGTLVTLYTVLLG
jgi:serine/threonine-protein kinase